MQNSSCYGYLNKNWWKFQLNIGWTFPWPTSLFSKLQHWNLKYIHNFACAFQLPLSVTMTYFLFLALHPRNLDQVHSFTCKFQLWLLLTFTCPVEVEKILRFAMSQASLITFVLIQMISTQSKSGQVIKARVQVKELAIKWTKLAIIWYWSEQYRAIMAFSDFFGGRWGCCKRFGTL